jgi:hypothetical protein
MSEAMQLLQCERPAWRPPTRIGLQHLQSMQQQPPPPPCLVRRPRLLRPEAPAECYL